MTTQHGHPDRLLAVDLGGTKVAVALLTLDGEFIGREQEPTCQTGPLDGIEQIARLLRAVLERGRAFPRDVLGIGIGIPAVLEAETDHVIWAPNLSGWRDVPLRKTLQSMLGMPVCVEYDGHTAVLGEWWLGAARGCNSVADIIIGTGIGGGLIMNGALVRGRDRLAGAAGWFAMTRDPAHDISNSQPIGHWESLAAGPGIVLRARQTLADYPQSILNAAPVGGLTAKDVFDADDRGDALARAVIDETADILGLGVANVVSLVNPEMVILGGSIGARRGARLLPRIRAVVDGWSQPISGHSVKLTSSGLGSDAGIIGAARAVLDRLGHPDSKPEFAHR